MHDNPNHPSNKANTFGEASFKATSINLLAAHGKLCAYGLLVLGTRMHIHIKQALTSGKQGKQSTAAKECMLLHTCLLAPRVLVCIGSADRAQHADSKHQVLNATQHSVHTYEPLAHAHTLFKLVDEPQAAGQCQSMQVQLIQHDVRPTPPSKQASRPAR